MDGTSPGNVMIDFGPTSPGWDRTVCGGGIPQAVNMTVGPCLTCGSTIAGAHMAGCPAGGAVYWPAFRLAPALSDSDIERIARRVVELLREGKL